MRQLGDLLIWVAMLAALVAVLYFTPQLAQFMSDEQRPAAGRTSNHDLASLGNASASRSIH
jgi:hypothetical protein